MDTLHAWASAPIENILVIVGIFAVFMTLAVLKIKGYIPPISVMDGQMCTSYRVTKEGHIVAN